MNTDIRLSVGFWKHPKTNRLERRLGLKGVRSLQILWAWASQNRPDGLLRDLDSEDVEFVSDWRGKRGAFTQAIIDLRWMDVNEDGGYALHDWQDHNGWASHAQERSRLAKEAASARWRNKTCGGNADGNADSNAETCGGNAGGNADGNAPSPSPSPSPFPFPEEIETFSSHTSSFCAEPAQAPPAAPEPEAPPPVPSEPAVMVFPLAKHGEEYAVTQTDIDEWQESYPGVDIHQGLRNCLQWNRDNPTRRKTKAGIRRHISGWLAREQNRKGGLPNEHGSPQPQRIGGGSTTQRLTANQAYMLEAGKYLTEMRNAEHRNNHPTTGPAHRALPGGGA